MKNKKRIIMFLLFIVLIAVIFIAGYTFSRYYTSVKTGAATASIAKWSFGSANSNTAISLSKEKIAPGTNGEFQIEVDATGSEVDVEYEILVTNEKNIPANMKFNAVTKNLAGDVIDTEEENSSFTELAKGLTGIIPVENDNQKRIITVTWDWPFDGIDDELDTNAGTLTYDTEENSSLDCGFNIEIIGKQVNPNP